MTTHFDIHDHRHELKQLRDSGETKLFDNRKELSCPACGEQFTKLFLTRKATTKFPENDGKRFCILQQEGELLLFRH